jgi:hypothetical protein
MYKVYSCGGITFDRVIWKQGAESQVIYIHFSTPDANSFRESQAQVAAVMRRILKRGNP